MKGIRRVLRLDDRSRESSVGDEVHEEVRFHIEARTRDLIEEGVAPDAARRQAESMFGDVTGISLRLRQEKRRNTQIDGLRAFVDHVRQDVNFTLRQLRRARGFTFVAVTTLALGIGAATTMFGILQAVVLQPLPFHEPDRLVRIVELTPQGDEFQVSDPDYAEWTEQSSSFESMGGLSGRDMVLLWEGEAERVFTWHTTPAFMATLGLTPVAGRDFGPDDARAGERPAVVLISESFWATRYGRDASVIGQTLILDTEPREIVGIISTPSFLDLSDLFLPYSATLDGSRSNHELDVVARLANKIDPLAAQAEIAGIAARLSAEYPEDQEGWSAEVQPLREWLVGLPVERGTLLMMGAVGSLLLIACLNVSNLLLARATTRRREVAIRRAIGAGRGRILGQLVTESMVLSLAGGMLGVLSALWALSLVRATAVPGLPRLDEATLDPTVLGVALAATMVAGLVFGLAPMLHARGSSFLALRSGTGSGSPTDMRVRGGLVVTEVALAVVLLSGASLLARSFLRLQDVDPGFDPTHVITGQLMMPSESYPAHERARFLPELMDRLQELPEVRAAGASMVEPFSGSDPSNFVAEDRPDLHGLDDFHPVRWRSVTPGWFDAMGVALLAGRHFDDFDTEEDPVAIVNRSLAEVLWPAGDPLGKRIVWGNVEGTRMRVVGVVEDVRDVTLQDSSSETIYLSYAWSPWARMNVVIRAVTDGAMIREGIREEMRRMAPGLAVPELRPVNERVRDAVARPRLSLLVLTVFSGLALGLASVGIYGVMAFSVARRTREIGIRVALGADVTLVRWAVIRSSLKLGVLGLGIGLAGALATERFIEGLLYDTPGLDSVTLIAVGLLLLTITVAAAYAPARRATQIHPRTALTVD